MLNRTTFNANNAVNVEAPALDPIGGIVAALGSNPALIGQLKELSPEHAKELASALVNELTGRIKDRNAGHLLGLQGLVNLDKELHARSSSYSFEQARAPMLLAVGQLRPGSSIRDAAEAMLGGLAKVTIWDFRELVKIAAAELNTLEATTSDFGSSSIG